MQQKLLENAVTQYGTQDGATKLMDWAQQKFKCCGTVGPTDYDILKGNGTTCGTGLGVKSCYPDEKCGGTDLYKAGCKTKFVDFVKHNLVVIGGVALAIAFIQVRYLLLIMS